LDCDGNGNGNGNGNGGEYGERKRGAPVPAAADNKVEEEKQKQAAIEASLPLWLSMQIIKLRGSHRLSKNGLTSVVAVYYELLQLLKSPLANKFPNTFKAAEKTAKVNCKDDFDIMVVCPVCSKVYPHTFNDQGEPLHKICSGVKYITGNDEPVPCNTELYISKARSSHRQPINHIPFNEGFEEALPPEPTEAELKAQAQADERAQRLVRRHGGGGAAAAAAGEEKKVDENARDDVKRNAVPEVVRNKVHESSSDADEEE
jgi:hypothetical protein